MPGDLGAENRLIPWIERVFIDATLLACEDLAVAVEHLENEVQLSDRLLACVAEPAIDINAPLLNLSGRFDQMNFRTLFFRVLFLSAKRRQHGNTGQKGTAGHTAR